MSNQYSKAVIISKIESRKMSMYLKSLVGTLVSSSISDVRYTEKFEDPRSKEIFLIISDSLEDLNDKFSVASKSPNHDNVIYILFSDETSFIKNTQSYIIDLHASIPLNQDLLKSSFAKVLKVKSKKNEFIGLVDRGRTSYDRKMTSSAIDIFNSVIEKYPTQFVGYYYLKRIHIDKKDYRSAFEILFKAYELCPNKLLVMVQICEFLDLIGAGRNAVLLSQKILNSSVASYDEFVFYLRLIVKYKVFDLLSFFLDYFTNINELDRQSLMKPTRSAVFLAFKYKPAFSLRHGPEVFISKMDELKFTPEQIIDIAGLLFENKLDLAKLKTLKIVNNNSIIYDYINFLSEFKGYHSKVKIVQAQSFIDEGFESSILYEVLIHELEKNFDDMPAQNYKNKYKKFLDNVKG